MITSDQVRSTFVNVSSIARDFSSAITQSNRPGSKHIRTYAHIRHITALKEISLPPEALISLTGAKVKLAPFDFGGKDKTQTDFAAVRTPSQLGLRYCFEPIRASDTLSIKWLLPGVRHLFATKPLFYIASLLSRKGPGSLTALLRSRELAHTVVAGVTESGRDFTWFEVRVEMTIFTQQQQQDDQGEPKDEDKDQEQAPVDPQEAQVVKLVQQYIAMATAPDSGFKWRWNEMKSMADLDFRFAEKDADAKYVSSLAGNMHHYPADKVIERG